MAKSFIFLHGISVRSGTNFVSRIMLRHPEVTTIGEGTISEFPLLKFIDSFQIPFNEFSKRYTRNNGKPTDFVWDNFIPYFGQSFKNYITDQLLQDNNAKYVFIKEPSVQSLSKFPALFPNSKLVILIRDGRDLIASSEKAYMAKNRGQSIFNRLKRHVKTKTGINFKSYVHAWDQKARTILNFIDGKVEGIDYLLLKYEDLAAEKKESYDRLFSYVDLDYNFNDFVNVEVIGSSFSDKIGAQQGKVVWQPIPKDRSFSSIKRSENWPKWKRNYFNKIAGESMRHFGYNI